MEVLCSTNLLLHLRKTAYVQLESLANRELRISLPLSTLSPPSSPPTCLQVGTQAPEVSVGCSVAATQLGHQENMEMLNFS